MRLFNSSDRPKSAARNTSQRVTRQNLHGLRRGRLHSVEEVESAALTQNPTVVPLLVRALGHFDGEVRLAAGKALAAFGEAGFQALLRAAAHGKGLQREEAVTRLGEWHDVRALQPLLNALQHDKRDRSVQTLLKLCFASLVTLFIGGIAALFRTGELLFNEQVGGIWAEAFKSDTSLRVHAAQALGNLGDLRALMPLVRLRRDKSPEVSAAVQGALAKLLPLARQLTQGQARVLGPQAIPELAMLLATADEILARDLVAVLRAIGDSRAIPAMERLSNDLTRPYLREQAREALMILHERAALEQARTTLLRGSILTQANSQDQLLRPAHGQPATTTPTEQLLRSTDSENT